MRLRHEIEPIFDFEMLVYYNEYFNYLRGKVVDSVICSKSGLKLPN